MRRFALAAALIVSVFSAVAQGAFFEGEGGSGHTIMFAESVIENGYYDKSDLWVAGKVKVNLISAMQRFGGFKCVDLGEARNILKIQKQLDSGIYDNSSSIEIGKLIKAKESLSIKTTRLPSGSYSMTITIFNVETGTIIGMFSSPRTYESAESYALQAHYDCIPEILATLKVKPTKDGIQTRQNEMKAASEQAAKNRELAKENAKAEEARSEKAREEAERRARIENEERERREAKEKAEAAELKKELAEKRTREAKEKERLAQERARLKQQNPFADETYVAEFENGSRYDVYRIKFTSQNECAVTVTSTDSKGIEKSVTKNGSYSFGNEILSISVRMPNDQVKHVQKIQWKGQVSFKNGYRTFFLLIPVSSNESAKKIRAEFNLR